MHGVCMQNSTRRSQKDRSDAMRAGLLRAGRSLFVRNGFAQTGTPQIVAAAGVTRGALYHHFQDKIDLFAAIIQAEAAEIEAFIDSAEFGGLTAVETLVQGGETYLAAMRPHGRARLMLIEAPAVLGATAMSRIDSATATKALRAGLAASGLDQNGAMSALLSATYIRAALAIDSGEAPGPWLLALERLVRGVVA